MARPGRPAPADAVRRPAGLRHVLRARRAPRPGWQPLAPRAARTRRRRDARDPQRPRGRVSRLAAAAAATSSSPPPDAAAAGWPSAWCTTSPSACDPEGADAWALQDVLATGDDASAPRRTRSTSRARTGACRRGARTGWPPPATPPYRDLLRAMLRARRWAAHRPRRRAVAAVVGAAGASPDRGHLCALRRRGDARHAGAGGAPGRRGGHRRGPRHGGAGGHRDAGGAADAGLRGAVVHPRRASSRRRRCCRPSAGRSARRPASPPTTCRRRSGFLRGEHVRARADLGLLDDVAAEWARRAPTARSWWTCCAPRACSSATSTDEDEIVVAMHALLAATPCRLVLVSPTTSSARSASRTCRARSTQYPNWRLPLPVTLEQLRA